MQIRFVEDLVKSKLFSEPTGHDYLHAQRVRKNAVAIAQHMNVNMDLIEVACLVHDLIDHKLDLKYTLSPDTLQKHLISYGYTKEFTKDVFNIITNISYSKNGTPSTIEGQIVQDADRLDALGAIGIARTFAFGGKNHRLIYGDPNKQDSITHFYDKLLKLEKLMNTNKAKEIAVQRTNYMKEFLDAFYKEI